MPSPRKPLWRRVLNLEFLARVAFVLSLCAGAYAYGAASFKWKIWPYQVLQKAKVGVEALLEVDTRKTPFDFIEFVAEADQAGPVKTFRPGDGSDLILITGGFYYRMDICPQFGCLAWIIDRQGKVLASWEVDPKIMFKAEDFATFKGFFDPENIVLSGIDIDTDGNIVATFQGRNLFPYHVGMAKFDKSGAILWTQINNSHHWPTIGPDGNLYAPSARLEMPPKAYIAGSGQKTKCSGAQKAIYQEGVRKFSNDGTLVREFWMEDVVRVSDANGLAYAVRDDCDPYHVNGVDVLNAAAAARVPGASVGDLLISLRSSSALVVVDVETSMIHHIESGPMVAQHSPTVLPDGTVLVFDNLGGSPENVGARILRLDLGSNWFETIYPRPGTSIDFRLISDEKGVVSASAKGDRLLVVDSWSGRILEIETVTGDVLWTYDEISDMTGYFEKFGGDPETPWVRQHTQGARFVGRDWFEETFTR